jgi:hypothetical protein
MPASLPPMATRCMVGLPSGVWGGYVAGLVAGVGVERRDQEYAENASG